MPHAIPGTCIYPSVHPYGAFDLEHPHFQVCNLASLIEVLALIYGRWKLGQQFLNWNVAQMLKRPNFIQQGPVCLFYQVKCVIYIKSTETVPWMIPCSRADLVGRVCPQESHATLSQGPSRYATFSHIFSIPSWKNLLRLIRTNSFQFP